MRTPGVQQYATDTRPDEARGREREASSTAVAVEWQRWPIAWSGVWVGGLTAIAVLVLFGLAGLAMGAHQVGNDARILRWGDFGFWPLVFRVLGAFFAFVAGGWVAVKVGGILQAEPGALHGGIVWLVTVPLLLLLASLGANDLFGSWFSSLGGTPFWAPAAQPGQVDPDAANAARNGAMAALTALLLGLMGAVLGGWMASGEPMTLTQHRPRQMRGRPSYG